jgi:hypothetical protein
MSEPEIPEICPGCPTNGRITGTDNITDPGTGIPLRRILYPCESPSYPYNPSINNPKRYAYCQEHYP